MVFDNCQIDVFFHMRNHYNRLRNVQSVVDCSPPKGLKRSTHTDTSFHYVGMAHQPNHGNEMKKHHCVYGNYTGIIRPRSTTGRSPRSKSVPPRPGTRRHPEDMPCTQEIYSKSSKLTYIKSARWMLDDKNTRFQSDGNSIQCSPQNSRKCDANACSKITNPTVCTLYGASTKSCPSTGRSVRLNTSNLTEKSTFSYQVPECSDFDESTRYNTPMSTPSCTDGNISPQDHEYLQFLLRITEDIIKNDLYTNKEMKKVFMSHIDANKDRLSLDRMLLRVHELMKELNMPLSDDTEEDSTPSWTEIETAMKGLLCLEKIKPKEKPVTPKSIRSKYKSTPDPEKKCICFDLRSLDINTANKSKMTEKEIESLNYEDLDSINKFKSSLDRLTECTEPISSRATCKVSAPTSCSTFGNIEVLPGFECLETPKASRGIAKEDIYQPRTPVKFTTEIGCSCAKRKKKSTKRRRKIKSSKFKNSRVISKRLKPNRRPKKVIEIKAEIENNESQDVRSEVPMCKKNTDKTVSKPLIISLDADNQTDGNNTYFRNSKNDYIFVKGPIYLLKAFLKENPNIVMRIEVPGDTFASTSVPILQKPGDYSHDPVRKPEDGSNSKKKENSKDKTMIDLLGDNYTTSISNGPIQLENFLTTREIQTEDIRVDPIIVATVLVQKDESDEDVSASIDDISNGSHHDLPKEMT
ncbi:hypothetical protein HHI36_000611 [Cryptolaemus montrouzieri]|uniref:Uncharacterized protein n=1 Tax=Cryptolaemus montrouzieri TaxID=559131 RepID=A0ABD2P5F2_9CUCU